jgi:pimeloyl-ACP methyl ester carboxylesterase
MVIEEPTIGFISVSGYFRTNAKTQIFPHRFVIVACLIATIGFAGCGDDDAPPPASSASAPQFEAAACMMPLPGGQEAADVECGFVTVPEDRSRPAGPTVRLAVAVLRATTERPADDPIIYLGSGLGPALDTVMQRFTAAFAAPLQGSRDIIFIDQRGTGHSRPTLACPEAVSPHDVYAIDQSVEADTARDVHNLLTCHDRLVREGINVGAYNTRALAADARDVARALGYRRWNLYGFSQSTRIAQIMMRDALPDEIRSVVLDSPIPITYPHLVDSAAGYQHVVQLIAADCAAAAGCRSRFPDMEQKAFDITAQLNAAPLTVRAADSATGAHFTAIFSGDRYAITTGLALQGADILAPLFPTLVDQVSRRRPPLLGAVAAAVNLVFDSALAQSVLCDDQVPLMTPDIITHATAGVRPELVHAFEAGFTDIVVMACAGWTGIQPTPARQPVTSDIPTLILHGQYDSAIPRAYGHQIAATLSHSTVVDFRGYGHGAIFAFATAAGPPLCAMRVVADFVANPERTPDVSCVADIGPHIFLGT